MDMVLIHSFFISMDDMETPLENTTPFQSTDPEFVHITYFSSLDFFERRGSENERI